MWQVIYHLEANTYTANAVYKTDDSIVTAIKVVLTEDNAHTVGFFGTDNGYLRKVSELFFKFFCKYYFAESFYCAVCTCRAHHKMKLIFYLRITN